MRRICVALLILLMIPFISGCGKDNSIELTEQNYEEYLNISTGWEVAGTPILDLNGLWGDEIVYYIVVKGASPNFNYNDVKINFIVSGKYSSYSLGKTDVIKNEDESVNYSVRIDTNIAGDCDPYNDTIYINGFTKEDLVDLAIYVHKVSGTITPAK